MQHTRIEAKDEPLGSGDTRILGLGLETPKMNALACERRLRRDYLALVTLGS